MQVLHGVVLQSRDGHSYEHFVGPVGVGWAEMGRLAVSGASGGVAGKVWTDHLALLLAFPWLMPVPPS